MSRTSIRSLVPFLALLGACNPRGGDKDTDEGFGDTDPDAWDVPPEQRPAAEVRTLPVGDEDCPNGGVAIELGLDDGIPGGTAGNGVLEPEEIDAVEIVCNGAPGADGAKGDPGEDGEDGEPGDDGEPGADGLTPLIVSTDVTDPLVCAEGGIELSIGFDDGSGGGTAGDGVLDPDEVVVTSVVCDGITGGDGADGDDAPLVDAVAADVSDCPAGGIVVRVGADDGAGGSVADDGVLQDGEVDSSSTLCAGEDGVDGADAPIPLFETDALGEGDPDCPAGGVRFRLGLDDGAGGGTADNGVLEPGEVSLLETVCNGLPAFEPEFPTPDAPADPGDGSLFSVAGGDASDDDGGEGGRITVRDEAAADNAWLRVHTTGSVDVATITTAPPALDLGSSPLVVSGDLVVQRYENASDGRNLPNGSIYWNGAQLVEVVTSGSSTRTISGVRVEAGASLFLTLEDAGTTTSATLSLDALEVAGTLAVDRRGDTTPLQSLRFELGEMWVRPSGVVDASGSLSDVGEPLDVSFFVTGARFGLGTARFEGSYDGVAAAPAILSGDLRVESISDLSWAGTVDLSGPPGVDVAGGAGGTFDASAFGNLFLGGTIDASGGQSDGDALEAGAGGSITAYARDLVFSGTLDASGGPGLASVVSGGADGGEGGEVVLQGTRRALRARGAVDVSGGDAAAGDGGEGGSVEFLLGAEGGRIIGVPFTADIAPRTGTLAVGGQVQAAGGKGISGGEGGTIDVTRNLSVPGSTEIQLLGFDGLDLTGGDAGPGFSFAGTGGDLSLERRRIDSSTNGSGQVLTSLANGQGGGIVLDAIVVAPGGAAPDAFGGEGGTVGFSQADTDPTVGSRVLVRAPIEVGGGAGGDLSGSGGGVFVDADADVQFSDLVYARGGTLEGTTPFGGGEGGFVAVSAGGVCLLDVDAVIDVSGSTGIYVGGEGGTVDLEADAVVLEGAIRAAGGAGVGFLADDTGDTGDTDVFTVGGEGGWIAVQSFAPEGSQLDGTLTTSGGAGDTGGEAGRLWIDGVEQVPTP